MVQAQTGTIYKKSEIIFVIFKHIFTLASDKTVCNEVIGSHSSDNFKPINRIVGLP